MLLAVLLVLVGSASAFNTSITPDHVTQLVCLNNLPEIIDIPFTATNYESFGFEWSVVDGWEPYSGRRNHPWGLIYLSNPDTDAIDEWQTGPFGSREGHMQFYAINTVEGGFAGYPLQDTDVNTDVEIILDNYDGVFTS